MDFNSWFSYHFFNENHDHWIPITVRLLTRRKRSIIVPLFRQMPHAKSSLKKTPGKKQNLQQYTTKSFARPHHKIGIPLTTLQLLLTVIRCVFGPKAACGRAVMSSYPVRKRTSLGDRPEWSFSTFWTRSGQNERILGNTTTAAATTSRWHHRKDSRHSGPFLTWLWTSF